MSLRERWERWKLRYVRRQWTEVGPIYLDEGGTITIAVNDEPVLKYNSPPHLWTVLALTEDTE